MKGKYEKSILTVTLFSDEDVITTSDINNAYTELDDLNDSGGRMAPNR